METIGNTTARLVLKTGLQQNRKAVDELALLAVAWRKDSPDLQYVANKLQDALKELDRALERLERTPAGLGAYAQQTGRFERQGAVTGRFVSAAPEEQPRQRGAGLGLVAGLQLPGEIVQRVGQRVALQQREVARHGPVGDTADGAASAVACPIACALIPDGSALARFRA